MINCICECCKSDNPRASHQSLPAAIITVFSVELTMYLLPFAIQGCNQQQEIVLTEFFVLQFSRQPAGCFQTSMNSELLHILGEQPLHTPPPPKSSDVTTHILIISCYTPIPPSLVVNPLCLHQQLLPHNPSSVATPLPPSFCLSPLLPPPPPPHLVTSPSNP